MGGAAVTIILRGAVPQTPTNAERLREYRNRAEPVIGNLHAWGWCKAARYAREQGPGLDYDNELREGFALKYRK